MYHHLNNGLLKLVDAQVSESPSYEKSLLRAQGSMTFGLLALVDSEFTSNDPFLDQIMNFTTVTSLLTGPITCWTLKSLGKKQKHII